jgi:hypothetical protein
VEEGRKEEVSIYEKIHDVYEYLSGKEIRWQEPRAVGVDQPWYLWFYAECGLYVIRDVMTDQFWFTKANSPMEALEKFKTRMQEAMEAGMYVEEDPE